MFQPYERKDDIHFTWDSIGDIIDGRQNLGEEMPVFIYRLFQFTLKDELIKRFGSEAAIDIFRQAGETAGTQFAMHMLDLTLDLNQFTTNLQQVLETTKIGVLKIEEFNAETGDATLTISEDLDCSGLPVTGETVCNYDEGFLAGVLKTYTKKNYIVTEVDCWATGSKVCRFKAQVKTINKD